MAQISMRSALVASLKELSNETAPHSWVSESGALVVGSYPNEIAWFDFGAEQFKVKSVPEANNPTAAHNEPESPPSCGKKRVSLLHEAPRVTGKLEIESEDTILEVGSATQALIHGLQLVESLAAGTLDKLAQEKGRSKRPVSRTKEDLYDLPSQARYSHQLENGFWVATNNKADESIKYLRRAIELAGLTNRVTVRWI